MLWEAGMGWDEYGPRTTVCGVRMRSAVQCWQQQHQDNVVTVDFLTSTN